MKKIYMLILETEFGFTNTNIGIAIHLLLIFIFLNLELHLRCIPILCPMFPVIGSRPTFAPVQDKWLRNGSIDGGSIFSVYFSFNICLYDGIKNAHGIEFYHDHDQKRLTVPKPGQLSGIPVLFQTKPGIKIMCGALVEQTAYESKGFVIILVIWGEQL